MTLAAGNIGLRPIRHRDRREWTAVRQENVQWLAPWEASNPDPGGYLPTYHEMVRALSHQSRTGAALPFVITRRVDGSAPQLAGQLTVSGILYGSARTATLGYWVDSRCAGRGIAPTAVALATDYCFRDLGLHRMEINIRPENAASLRVVEKLGFRDEGIRSRYLHINGQWADHRSFALTAEDIPQGLLKPWLEQQGRRP